MLRTTLLMTLLSLAAAIVTAQELELKQNANGKYGFVNRNGTEVIPCRYDYAGSFIEGLAVVKQNGKYGFIDYAGKEVISPKYDMAYSFSHGLAEVKQFGKWGYIDKKGTVVIPIQYSETEAEAKLKEHFANRFSFFTKSYVEAKINEWQKKGPYEPTADWQRRVTETTRRNEINRLTKEAEEKYIAEQAKKTNHVLKLDPYDPDNKSFLITDEVSGTKMVVPVPLNEAPTFANSWSKITRTPQYAIDIAKDQIAIAEMTFRLPNGKSYKYSNKATLNYTIAQINYDFEPIVIDLPGSNTSQQGQQNIGTVSLTAGSGSQRPSATTRTVSDIAMNIPKTNAKNNKTWVLIIANENYRFVSNVEFAINDGEVFRQYCIQTLGVPENNILFEQDATRSIIEAELERIIKLARTDKEEASIIFYYAGHGMPDEKTQTAYLLPVDGLSSNLERSAFRLDDLYKTFGATPAQKILVIMDACFSGAQRGSIDQMLVAGRSVAIKPKPSMPTGNTIVFSATTGDESAFPFREQGHGLFTYYLLKKFQETKGDVSLGDLFDYTTRNVNTQAIRVNRNDQTPTVIPSRDIEEKWRGLKLR